jgi:hypothetical protein
MFYVHTIILPLLIAVCLYFILRPASKESTINYGLSLVILLFAYSFGLYVLEMTDILSSGWAFYSLIFFLIPITVVLVITKVAMVWKKPRK